MENMSFLIDNGVTDNMNGYRSKADLAYEGILKDISSGFFAQGEKLITRQISKRYNVSEIPIREALKRLESEGYVTHSANKSVVVSIMDKSTLTKIFQIKGVLEGYATRISIDYLTESDLNSLEEINKKIETAYSKHSNDDYSSLNNAFHAKIYEKNPNQELTKLIMDLWKKWAMTKRVFNVSPERVKRTIEDHKKIIELIRNKKYDDVETFVREHKFNAGREMVKKLEDNDSHRYS